jgi:hemerythrin superfamily protein
MVRITDAIAKDHRLLESYYETILSAEDADERTRFQNQFTWELARHSVAEELVVYPAMAKYLRNGDQPVDKDRQEHQTVRECDQVEGQAQR